MLATVTECHCLGQMSATEVLIPTVVETANLRSDVDMVRFWWGLCPWLKTTGSSCGRERMRLLCGVPFVKSSSLIYETIPSWHNHTPGHQCPALPLWACCAFLLFLMGTTNLSFLQTSRGILHSPGCPQTFSLPAAASQVLGVIGLYYQDIVNTSCQITEAFLKQILSSSFFLIDIIWSSNSLFINSSHMVLFTHCSSFQC